MRLSLGSVAALAAGLLVAFAFFPVNQAVQGPPPLFAQNKLSQNKSTPKKSDQNKSKPAGMRLRKPSRAPARALEEVPSAAPSHVEHPLSSDVGEHPRIEAALESITDFTIDPQPLKEALDFIAQHYQIPLIADTKALDDASVDTTTEVKLQVKGLKLRQVLTLLLEPLPQPLGFDIWDGVLRVTTGRERIAEHRIVVVYDCRDLIHLRSMNPPSAGQPGTEAKPSSGVGVFSVVPTRAETARQFGGRDMKPPFKKAEKPAKTPCAQPENPLIRVIRYAGGPDDWQDEEGGAETKITELGGLIVVNQNPLVHEEIKKILADLRRMKQEGAFATLEKNHISAAIPAKR